VGDIERGNMKWTKLTSLEQLDQIDEESKTKSILILKHSTACNISSMALNRIESKWKSEYADAIVPFYLDLLNFRNISNEISNRYQIIHESPQVLIISGGQCTYDESHSGIRLSDILSNLNIPT
jgi:bacillithiol system protein YtxJ